jgi:tripartite-type tricarboxylate transporter receptor subunit TctC
MPATTPRAIVEKLNAVVVTALSSDDLRKRLAELGAEPMPMKPTAFDAFLKGEIARVDSMAKEAGIEP